MTDPDALNLPLAPHGDYILVAPIETPPPKGHDGRPLILPPSAQRLSPPSRGVVLAVGDGRVDEDGSRRPVAVPLRALVAFKKHAGTDVEWRGIKLTLMREHEVLAVLVDESGEAASAA